MTPTERAAELGREHGTAAGEAWAATHPARAIQLAFHLRRPDRYHSPLWWPEPDLTGKYDYDQLHSDVHTEVGNYQQVADVDDAYCAAFRAAVREVVEGKVTQ